MCLSFPREIGLKRALCKNKSQWDSYVRMFGNRTSCYTSLYSFTHLNEYGRADYASALIDRAWWDFDSGALGTIDEVKTDVATLLSRLDGDIRLVATGRGFHIHQLFDEPVRGLHWDRKLQAYEKMMAHGLKTLDGVGNLQKLTRIPGTYNPRRGKWAIPIDHKAFMANPAVFTIPKKPYEGMEKYDPYYGSVRVGFDFLNWASTAIIKDDVELPQGNIGEITDSGEVPIMPCLDRAIRVDNPSHHVRVALVQHMAEHLRDFAHPRSISPEEKKAIEESIFQFINGLGWRDFKPSRTRQGIRSSMNYERSPTCAWFISRNMCPGKCWRYDGTGKQDN